MLCTQAIILSVYSPLFFCYAPLSLTVQLVYKINQLVRVIIVPNTEHILELRALQLKKAFIENWNTYYSQDIPVFLAQPIIPALC